MAHMCTPLPWPENTTPECPLPHNSYTTWHQFTCKWHNARQYNAQQCVIPNPNNTSNKTSGCLPHCVGQKYCVTIMSHGKIPPPRPLGDPEPLERQSRSFQCCHQRAKGLHSIQSVPNHIGTLGLAATIDWNYFGIQLNCTSFPVQGKDCCMIQADGLLMLPTGRTGGERH